jgi:hypothetical protein
MVVPQDSIDYFPRVISLERGHVLLATAASFSVAARKISA